MNLQHGLVANFHGKHFVGGVERNKEKICHEFFSCKNIWKKLKKFAMNFCLQKNLKVWKNLTMKIFFSKNMNKTRENKIALAQVQIKDANFMLTKLFYLILTLHTFCDYTTLYFHEFITNKYVVLSKFTFRGWAPTGWQNGHLPPWKLGLRTQSI